MLSEYEYKKAFELLDELLDEYNIPNKKSEDGIARIDGLTVEEYFDKIGLFNDIIDNIYDMPTQDIEDIAEIDYEDNEDNEDINEFILAA
nr:MAG TPA: hypothetical protein [Caudoviricetes sp.]